MREGTQGLLTLDLIRRALIRSSTKSVDSEHISYEMRHRSAIHEAGHAAVGVELGYKLLYTTVVPQNNGMGGLTSFEDMTTVMRTLRDMQKIIATLIAGSIAEEVVLGEASTMSANDRQIIENVCKEMVGTGLAENTSEVQRDIEKEITRYLQQNKGRLERLAQKLEEADIIYEKEFMDCWNETDDNA